MRLINKKYQAVIFDLFGTLVENFSRGEYEKTLAEMAAVLGMHAVLIRAPDEAAEAHTIDREEWHGHIIASLEEVLNLVK